MENKKLKKSFLFCIALFLAALLVSLLVSGSGGNGHNSVVINEVMASNRTCLAPNGKYLDYIEIRNLSDGAIDVSGYMISDKPDSIGYIFPQGTVISAGGCAVAWCDKDAQSADYASFGVSSDGTDTLYLYNSVNVLVDKLDVPVMHTNIPLIRTGTGLWQEGSQPTPGFDNSQAGYDAWLASRDTSHLDVVISEVLTGSSCLSLDGSDRITDWVELWNRGSTDAVLTGGYLTDDPDNPIKWQIPDLTIAPGQRVVIRCAGDSANEGDATFALPRDGCTVVLSGPMGNTLSSVQIPLLGRDISWSLGTDGTYTATEQATPGYENTESGYQAWLSALDQDSVSVVISEVMSANRSTVLNSDGKLVDWIELYNPGSTAAVLTGGYLSNDPNDRGKWQIPDLTIQPGQRVVILCSGTQAAEGEASFSISREGSPILLSGTMGQLLCRVDLPAMDQDRTWALQSDGTYAVTDRATPGYENTDDAYARYLTSQSPAGALVISEVMPSNDRFFLQSDGQYYDWVELRNASSQPIDLSDYSLSDDPDQPDLFPLPQQILEPGQRVIVICSGNTALGGRYIHAPFTLGRDESWLYVTGPDSRFSDYIRIYDVPYGGSVGRMEDRGGTFYFTEPTPAATNGTGVVFISSTPTFLTEAGVYNNITDLRVELSGSNIRYTTDGSRPTIDSTPYSGPIFLDATTVIRAASFENGKARSDVVTAAYIINENHTLPVISIATEPGSLFDDDGLYVDYTTEREVPCNITLFEDGGGFTIDCGLKMFGHMGLTLPKKSFKVNFRGRYGQDYLTYPVYGEDGPQLYDSLVIRSGQDYPNTIFRDELFTSLCQEASESVLVQRHKFCILYINGQYWGIYCMKEAFGETMYAENYGVDQTTVSVEQAPVETDSPVFELMSYCMNNNLSIQENYEYFASQMDVDSLIDWMIFEGYSANTDVKQNLRYFKSTATGDKWQHALYDLDWAWYFEIGFAEMLSPSKPRQYANISNAALRNPEFREKFFTRVAELKNGVLSDEHVLERIDEFAELLSPEIAREKARWGGSYQTWERNVQNMRSYLTQRDHWASLIQHLRRFAGLTDEEYQKYFAE